MFIHRSCEEM